MRSFNCTFMELKYWNGKYNGVYECVLIVPLWN